MTVPGSSAGGTTAAVAKYRCFEELHRVVRCKEFQMGKKWTATGGLPRGGARSFKENFARGGINNCMLALSF
jgi:hypothetical protein